MKVYQLKHGKNKWRYTDLQDLLIAVEENAGEDLVGGEKYELTIEKMPPVEFAGLPEYEGN